MLIEVLESRQLLTAAYPTDLEQYFVELTNRARMNPTAEAKRFGIDLNEGLAPGTLASTPRQPLAINPFLTSAARKYSKALLNPPTGANPNKGQLDHLLNGTTPWGRAQAEGYPSGLVSENLVWSSKSNTTATTADVEKGHELLFKDFTANFEVVGRGHRKNILNGDRKEVGIGLVVGPFGNWTAHVGTQDFGTNGPGVFLTGVVFTDKVVDNDFYTPGEGIGGITIKAVRSTDKKAFSTRSWASGGYSWGSRPAYTRSRPAAPPWAPRRRCTTSSSASRTSRWTSSSPATPIRRRRRQRSLPIRWQSPARLRTRSRLPTATCMP